MGRQLSHVHVTNVGRIPVQSASFLCLQFQGMLDHIFADGRGIKYNDIKVINAACYKNKHALEIRHIMTGCTSLVDGKKDEASIGFTVLVMCIHVGKSVTPLVHVNMFTGMHM